MRASAALCARRGGARVARRAFVCRLL